MNKCWQKPGPCRRKKCDGCDQRWQHVTLRLWQHQRQQGKKQSAAQQKQSAAQQKRHEQERQQRKIFAVHRKIFAVQRKTFAVLRKSFAGHTRLPKGLWAALVLEGVATVLFVGSDGVLLRAIVLPRPPPGLKRNDSPTA